LDFDSAHDPDLHGAAIRFLHAGRVLDSPALSVAPIYGLLAFSFGLAVLAIHWVNQMVMIKLPRRKFALPAIMAPGLLWARSI